MRLTAADRRPPPPGAGALAAGVLAAVLIGACGLPSESALGSPVRCAEDAAPGTMTFCQPESKGDSFRGYEIYYKLITSVEATPQPRHHDDLRARFGRLSNAASRSCDGDRPPLVSAADAEAGDTVTFDVGGLRTAAAAEPFLLAGQGRIEVRRGIEDPGDPLRACRPFSAIDGYRAGHRDLSAAAAAALTARTGALIEMVAYVVSYGSDGGQTLYSAPLLIGRERLDLY